MVQLLIVAHAPLASALQQVAAHAFPDQAHAVRALDVGADDEPEWVERRLRALLVGTGDTLVMVDAFGATPSNAAVQVADGFRVRVLSGVNVPMLWRALSYRHQPLDRLIALAQSGATQGVMQVFNTQPQQQPSKASGHAKDHAQDQ